MPFKITSSRSQGDWLSQPRPGLSEQADDPLLQKLFSLASSFAQGQGLKDLEDRMEHANNSIKNEQALIREDLSRHKEMTAELNNEPRVQFQLLETNVENLQKAWTTAYEKLDGRLKNLESAQECAIDDLKTTHKSTVGRLEARLEDHQSRLAVIEAAKTANSTKELEGRHPARESNFRALNEPHQDDVQPGQIHATRQGLASSSMNPDSKFSMAHEDLEANVNRILNTDRGRTLEREDSPVLALDYHRSDRTQTDSEVTELPSEATLDHDDGPVKVNMARKDAPQGRGHHPGGNSAEANEDVTGNWKKPENTAKHVAIIPKPRLSHTAFSDNKRFSHASMKNYGTVKKPFTAMGSGDLHEPTGEVIKLHGVEGCADHMQLNGSNCSSDLDLEDEIEQAVGNAGIGHLLEKQEKHQTTENQIHEHLHLRNMSSSPEQAAGTKRGLQETAQSTAKKLKPLQKMRPEFVTLRNSFREHRKIYRAKPPANDVRFFWTFMKTVHDEPIRNWIFDLLLKEGDRVAYRNYKKDTNGRRISLNQTLFKWQDFVDLVTRGGVKIPHRVKYVD